MIGLDERRRTGLCTALTNMDELSNKHCRAIDELCSDFEDCLHSEELLCLDDEYMRMHEILFLLKNVREVLDRQLYLSYGKASTVSSKVCSSLSTTKCVETPSSSSSTSFTREDRAMLIDSRKYVEIKIRAVRNAIERRLHKVANSDTPWVPRAIRLCKRYQMTEKEMCLYHLMTVVQGSCDPHVLNALVDEQSGGGLTRMLGMQRICEIAEVEMEIFCDSERLHIKEGMVLVEEDNGLHYNLRSPRTAVQLLYGRELKRDELLKVSQTALEDIMNEEDCNTHLLDNKNVVKDGDIMVGDEDIMEDDYNSSDDESIPTGGPSLSRVNSINSSPRFTLAPIVSPTNSSLRRTRSASSSSNPQVGTGRKRKKIKSLTPVDSMGNGDVDITEDSKEFSIKDLIQVNGDYPEDFSKSTSDINLEGYTNLSSYAGGNQLEYLEECFQVVALMIRVYAAKMKDDMKKEGTRVHNWEGDVKHGKRELQAKLRLLEAKIKVRVDMSAIAPPRLEVLSSRLKLDAFERKVILFLIGRTVSPVVKVLLESIGDGGSRGFSDDCATVGQCLAILCDDFKTQIDYRNYFYKNSKLLQNGIVSLNKNRWHQGTGDLTDQRIALDRRILDWVVGLDSEINELVEGSDLYVPKVNLSQVVLPEGHLKSLLSQCLNYDAFREYRRKSGLDDTMSYGNSLVILLCGKSGTGKTMTVNAIAKEMKKKVLLVDFGSLSGRRDGSDLDADLKGLFREAHMSNAVIFFDECEVVFRSRSMGGDRLLNSLLTEIERHEGIVFLATNRPYELDEAMHRRITAVIEFQPPDHTMRRKIWNNLLSQNLTLSSCVDTSALAVKYELSGGFIKNAVLSAVLSALNRDQLSPVLTQEDLISGCKLQMRGNMSDRNMESSVLTTLTLKDLDLTTNQIETAWALKRFELSRAKVYGTWYSHPPANVPTTIDTKTEPATVKREASSSSLNGVNYSDSSEEFIGNKMNTQRGCIALFAGPSGAGKKTLAQAISNDLERKCKIIHTSDILITKHESSMSLLTSLVQDAKLADSVIIIEGFEHILDDTSGEAGNGWKIQLFLARVLDCLFRFPGCVILLANVDSPQNLSLHRDFASRLFCLLKFTVPPADVRAQLWKRLLPPYAPMSNDVNISNLGRRFELYPGSIRSAIARACAEVGSGEVKFKIAAGTNEKKGESQSVDEKVSCRILTQKDLIKAGEAEVAKLRGGNYELMEKLFT